MSRILTFILFLLFSCFITGSWESSGQDFIIYKEQYVIDSLPGYLSVGELDDWVYFTGNSEEGLHAGVPEWPDSCSIVSLPHRLLLPNTPMWYRSRVLVEDSIVLRISADDGAQVFFEDLRVPSFFPGHYRLWEVEDSTYLYIRVINNAMKGGLQKVELMTPEYYRIIQKNEFISIKALMTRSDPNNLEVLAGPLLILDSDSTCIIKIQVSGTEPVGLFYSSNNVNWEQADLRRTEVWNIYNFSIPVNKQGGKCNYFFRQGSQESEIYELEYNQAREKVRFTVWGDSQGGWDKFRQLIHDMEDRELDFTIGLGDLVANGSDHSQWSDWHQSLQPLGSRIPVFPIAGNHDYDGYYDNLIPEYYHKFVRDSHYFSWTWRNAAFIALDPNEDFPIGIRGKQKRWLQSQFDSPQWDNAKWRFILIHQPPYSESWDGYHGDEFIREIIEENAETKAIDFVLSGHSHAFEKWSKKYGSQFTHFIILGGAGGSLEDIRFSGYHIMDTVIVRHHYGLFELKEDTADLLLIGVDGDTLYCERFLK